MTGGECGKQGNFVANAANKIGIITFAMTGGECGKRGRGNLVANAANKDWNYSCCNDRR